MIYEVDVFISLFFTGYFIGINRLNDAMISLILFLIVYYIYILWICTLGHIEKKLFYYRFLNHRIIEGIKELSFVDKSSSDNKLCEVL
jgi:hypothetical protein